jgi:coenzyme F420 hydrogenase subunit beta
MKSINKILDLGLCLGCGLCETICSREKCEMQINAGGFYSPIFKTAISKNEKQQILACCPAIHVESEKTIGVWATIKQISEAWSADPVIRKKSASGGVITTLAIYLLEQNIVDGVLHVGVEDDSYLYNRLRVSRTKEDVIRNAASRYAPALMFDKMKETLDASTDVYAFIGKPCDIAGLKNFLSIYPHYQYRLKYYFAIFCAGMPSYAGTNKVLEASGYKEEPCSIKYRGDGWPGLFEAKYKSHSPFQISYIDSWGKVLGKHLGYRCKICPDGIGILADIAVGDSWNTKDGYPDFAESDGRSFVLVRTDCGLELFRQAIQAQKIVSRDLDINKLATLQFYQYQRRLMAGYRVLAVQILTGMFLKFRGLGIYTIMWKASIREGLANMLGTAKRFVKLYINYVDAKKLQEKNAG